jgi:hypothetical protein
VFTPKLEIPERGLLLIGFNYRRFRSRLGQGGVWGERRTETHQSIIDLATPVFRLSNSESKSLDACPVSSD